MVKANLHFLDLKDSYLFSTVREKTEAYMKVHPEKEVLKLGVGDVTLPLVPAVIDALEKASAEMGDIKTFRGYPPEGGYAFLKKAIIENDYAERGVKIDDDELFVSDGAKCDTGNIVDIFGSDNTVLVADPVYPVYVDTNIMSGRKIKYVNGTAENGFCPEPPDFPADMVYICSPNNPTGAAMDAKKLGRWVAYAKKHGAVILFDSAYEAYINDTSLPHSIYEIEGAKDCAIEFRSFSKTAGFTGVRCGYSVVPKTLKAENGVSLNALWARRHATKYNGTPYIVQRAAEAVYSDDGKKQIKANIDYYMSNAAVIRKTLSDLGLTVFGGENAPYIWFRCPFGMTSWEFFDYLLEKVQVVGTPGSGFGAMGEGYFRLTSFGSKEITEKALERISSLSFR